MPPVLDEVERELTELLAVWGFELVALRYSRYGRGGRLSLVIDKPGGVTVGDCQLVSERVGDYLDVVDPIPHKYMLEVTSPGVDRLLTKDQHFMDHLGQQVCLSLTETVRGSRRVLGTLKGLTAAEVYVEVVGSVLAVPREYIREARLVYDEG